MSDSIITVMRNYISVEMCSFWRLFLERNEQILTFLTPIAPRVPQKGLKNVLTKNNATIELLMQNYVSI